MTDDVALTLRRGYPPSAHRVIACDYDGTIFPFGHLDGDPDPLPGAAEGLQKLHRRGYRIVIYTSRMSRAWLDSSGHSADEMRERIADALTRHGIPFHDITGEKVPAMAYIDDLAVRYSDNWPEIVDWLLFTEEPS